MLWKHWDNALTPKAEWYRTELRKMVQSDHHLKASSTVFTRIMEGGQTAWGVCAWACASSTFQCSQDWNEPTWIFSPLKFYPWAHKFFILGVRTLKKKNVTVEDLCASQLCGNSGGGSRKLKESGPTAASVEKRCEWWVTEGRRRKERRHGNEEKKRRTKTFLDPRTGPRGGNETTATMWRNKERALIVL